jgi:signal transduction histidine kinase
MKKNPETPKMSLRRAYQNAAGPVALSYRVFALFAIPSFGAFLIYDATRLGGNFLTWLFLATVVYAVTILVLLGFKWIYQKQNKSGSRPVFITSALLIAGVARGFAAWALGMRFGIVPQDELTFRLIGGAVFVSGSLITMSIFVASQLKHEVVLGGLESEKAVLDELRGGIRERIKIQQETLLATVQQALAPVIKKVKEFGAASEPALVIAELKEAVDQVVRPLSHDVGSAPFDGAIAGAGASSTAYAQSLAKAKRTWPKSVSVGAMFMPGITAIVAAISTFTPISLGVSDGSSALLASALLSVFAYLVLKAAQQGLALLWLPLWLAGVVVALTYLALALLTRLVLPLANFYADDAAIGQYFLLLLIAGSFAFMQQVVRTQRLAAELQLKEVIENLAILNSQLRQEVWLNRRRIASVLHGPVQAALYASAMRLAQAKAFDKSLIEVVQRDIEHALLKLEEGSDGESFRDVANQIASLWAGACDIDVEISADAEERISANRVAETCVTEVVREAISNAVKHGEATNAKIKISLERSRLVRVVIENDGIPARQGAKTGFGSDFLDEVAYAWSLNSASGTTTLKAKIAI